MDPARGVYFIFFGFEADVLGSLVMCYTYG